MKDLSKAASVFSIIPHKAKVILLASSIISAVAVPTVYILKQETVTKEVVAETQADIIGDDESAITDDLSLEGEDSFNVMQEDFFGTEETKEEVEEVEPVYNQDPGEFAGNGVKRGSFFSDLNPPPSPKEEQKIFSPPVNKVPEPHPLQPISQSKSSSKNFAKNKGETKYFNHDEEEKDDIAELLADKDYPSTIASKPHDLSRLLTTDSFIPAVMYTAINSEIPSKTVLAVVESDVVGFHGDNILIPKGSKVEGVYEKLENKHARRMQITWFKITRPDGIIIKLDGESSDMQGAGGLGGYLDQRLKDRYGGALLLSSINALAQMSVREDDIRQLAAVESFGREFGTLTAQVIRENINAMPIIMIRQGTRFNIRPYQNIYFPKPINKSVKALFINDNR
jgi:type IV secretory pathway VirB10-like protein